MKYSLKETIKNWIKIITVLLIGILINIFPILVSIHYDNWWLMLLYIVVPIMDVIYIIILNAILEMFK